MKLSEPAFPPHPQPQQARPPQVQPPMVYVYEKQEWDYKIIVKNAVEEELLSERELNVLGKSGWELVGVVALPGKAQFYFKRART